MLAALPLAALACAALPQANAAAVNPLPAVASALNGVSSYQVVVTSASIGAPPRRPTGTRTPTPPRNGRTGTRRGPGLGIGFGFGPQTRTITSVRKNGLFEEHITITGKDRTGKATSTDVLIYGKEICSRASGAKTYSCQTSTQFNYSLDPTAAFTQGAGSTAFSKAGSKTVGGQSCNGYAYVNQSQYATTKGTVYISTKTNLPCEQDSTSTRHFSANGGSSVSFSQKTTAIWSRFNDKSLSVPSMPK
jgi:hypothetical protein